MKASYKPGDKVTIIGVGIGYVRECCPDNTYYLYIVNQRRTGGGWKPVDLMPGWPRGGWDAACRAA